MTVPEELKPAPPAAPRAAAWAAWIGAAFAIQLAAIWLLSAPGPAARTAPSGGADALVGGVAAAGNLPLNDPTLLALASPEGFSGPAWLSLPRPTAKVVEWSTPETWLNQGATNWGDPFLAAARQLAAPPLTADKPAPKLFAISLPPPAPPSSVLRVTGALAGRALLSPITPRVWPHDDVLADTVVRLAVDAAGRVQSAAVISHAGVRDPAQALADNHALELARAARFAPLAAEAAGAEPPLMFGNFIIQWSVVPPARN